MIIVPEKEALIRKFAGRKIRFYRKKAKMTQDEFGIRLAKELGKKADIQATTISNWEYGRVPIRNLEAIAKVLNVTVDDLNHLHRGGRVSKTSAVLGTMVQIKPIIIMDDNGCLKVVGKERGRKKSLHKIVDMAAKQAEGYENEIIMITHGDCPEDAEYVAKRVQEKMGIQNIYINNIGTVIGGHTGPGVVAVFCMGDKREVKL